jgi:hypothetical protein
MAPQLRISRHPPHLSLSRQTFIQQYINQKLNMKNYHQTLFVIICATLSGCNPQAETQPKSMSASAPSRALELSSQLRDCLATADAADGKTDKVVEKCIGCSLGMSGDSKFTSTLGDYRLQFCSAGCKKEYDTDPEKALVALRAPAN